VGCAVVYKAPSDKAFRPWSTAAPDTRALDLTEDELPHKK
jgi:hypothetical protein